MSWFYRDGDKVVGPFGKAEMQEAVRLGTITDDTLVRSEKSSQWKTLRQMREEAGRRKTQGQASGGAAVAEGVGPQMGPDAAKGVICSECGQYFAEDEVINYKGYNICASCKPIFIQKLKEGTMLPNTMVYAGFWIRAGAKIIDLLILSMINMVFSTLMGIVVGLLGAGSLATNAETPEFSPLYFVAVAITMLLQIAVPIFYTTFFVGKYAATLGKMACGLKIVTAEGERVSYLRAFGRYFAEIISSITLGIGYIMAGFDDEKRALHDRICSTRVIEK